MPLRIIPARAGFTTSKSSAAASHGDHPRSRGVYSTDSPTRIRIVGSSPLARGLRSSDGASGRSSRIIPARAGFTGTRRCGIRGGKDHPRSRGVYLRSRSTSLSTRGSSPLARGLPRDFAPPMQRAGIIPARAGFTAIARLPPVELADHPRSRGVYPPSLLRSGDPVGSSPLARGLRPLWKRFLR